MHAPRDPWGDYSPTRDPLSIRDNCLTTTDSREATGCLRELEAEAVRLSVWLVECRSHVEGLGGPFVDVDELGGDPF